ncbi:MAG: 3D domain-containing protein [Verrucomicrobiota bacterium]
MNHASTIIHSKDTEGAGPVNFKPSVLRVSARNFFTLLGLLLLCGCATGRKYRVPRNQKPEIVKMETTGYCKCGKCCGWKRNWKFQPVVAYGPTKGRPKTVGITASGTRAGWGTIAADTRHYPFGTIIYIPDYGWGRVEDIGGGIKGKHIDLYFPSHRQALEWGREWKQVKIWKPRGADGTPVVD